MRFEQIISSLAEGSKYRRNAWVKGSYIQFLDGVLCLFIHNGETRQNFRIMEVDICASDWELFVQYYDFKEAFDGFLNGSVYSLGDHVLSVDTKTQELNMRHKTDHKKSRKLTVQDILSGQWELVDQP